MHRIQIVAGGGYRKLSDDGTRTYRVEHELEEGVLILRSDGIVEFLSPLGEIVPLGENAFVLAVVEDAENSGVDLLGLPSAVEAGVTGNQVRDFLGMDFGKCARCPLSLVFSEFVVGPTFGVPSVGQEKVDGEFHGLEIAHVNHPEAVGVVLPREVHLLPDLGKRNRVDPFVGAGTPDVVKVVVYSGTSGTFAFFFSGEATDVAPIVIAP
ncbi:MAG: hypothetical protein BWY82_00905 [Verrucomicrobia bacterium ADurb.Bin474]|nr:MAG: hypothetical protein BWY82_00905 [Verrucomicrobia bacterium ADurb.Bin474]